MMGGLNIAPRAANSRLIERTIAEKLIAVWQRWTISVLGMLKFRL